jgi:hypothetical protein
MEVAMTNPQGSSEHRPRRDADELIGTMEDFARRQPVAFLGGAVAAGFGFARFMRSSAERRRGAAASAGTFQGDRP